MMDVIHYLCQRANASYGKHPDNTRHHEAAGLYDAAAGSPGHISKVRPCWSRVLMA